MKFNQDRFNESDLKARNATRLLFKTLEPSWTLIENPNQYGVDFIVYSKGNLVAYIEAELSYAGFEGTKFKYDSIRLLPRKDHFMDSIDANGRMLSAPIYLVTVSSDAKAAIVYEMKTMAKNSVKVKSFNKVPHGESVLEEMHSLSTKFCSTFSI